MKRKEVIIYTDGACSGNPGRGGWAAVLTYKDTRLELSGSEEETTNNRMELYAAIAALRQLKEACDVELYSDSSYLVDAFNKNWLTAWQRRGWMRKGGEEVKNIDLWQELLTYSRRHNISWHWVKGHAENAENNRCDILAKEAIKAQKI